MYEREHIGSVNVESGRFVMLDPKALRLRAAQVQVAAEDYSLDEAGCQCLDGVVIGTEYQNGIYEVFVSKSEGRITIELEERE